MLNTTQGIPEPDATPAPITNHPEDVAETDTHSEPVHPMAHLMPQKAAPSEASRKAAEIRAARKAKAKKVKFGVAAGCLLVAVVAGPPLFKWLGNAINDAGSTSTEQPAD